jgi:hypothetical protein
MPTEDALPRNPRLDPFRDAVWELSHEGTVEAHLVTNVSHFRYWPLGRKHHDSVWFKVCWLDGRQDMPEDDYGPEWYFVSDLEQGTFEVSARTFDAKPVEGPRRHELREQYSSP